MEITKIRKFAEPELNRGVLQDGLPAGGCHDEAGFDKSSTRRSERCAARATISSRCNCATTCSKADLKMPEAFLKRWLYTINEASSRWRRSRRTSTSS